jgi:hypothetical protein
MNRIRKFKSNIPKTARYLNTAMAGILIVLGIYHYTQPNAAWRSGTIESITAVLLLAAAYEVSNKAARVINIVLAGVLLSLGIRHLAIGGGWVSGSIEIVFAALLVFGAAIMYKTTKKGITKST